MPSCGDLWRVSRDADPAAYALACRHYSFTCYADGRRENEGYRNRRHFVGPGQKLVLLTPAADALFVWRKFMDRSGQTGVNCALFRNESPILSSRLILAAEQFAWQRWPGERLYTYVNARRIRSSNPGCCFQAAGWRVCGRTKKRKLIILEKLAWQR